MMPGNPAFGSTVLRIPAEQSPNFVTGTSGWKISQDGSAEFNDVTIRAGEVIDGTALYYSPSPGAGNLVASISAVAGSDEFGNAYPAGIMSQQSAGNQVVIAGNIIEFLTSSTPLGYGGIISAFGNGDLLVAGLGAVTGDTPAAFDLLSEHVTGSAPMMVMQNGGPGAATAIVANQPGAALRTPEDWHTVTTPTGMTGTIRVKVLPLYNLAVLDINVTITSTNTTATSYTTGNLPSSAYYPAGARQYDTSVNQKFTTVSNASPRINIPTSGALTFDMPGFASSGLSCIVSGTILYPLD